MIAFLLDEMFPPAASRLLREQYGHDAKHVFDMGLQAAEDERVATAARTNGRAIVTENVADFAAEHDVVLVFILKRSLPRGKAQAAALAATLHRWATKNPDPYLGHHWPPTA